MATETSTETVTTPVTPAETADKANTTATTQGTTSETEGNGTQQTATTGDQTLPDTHPLVKAFEAQKEELKTLKAAGQQSKDKTSTELATATAELTSTKDELTAIQTKYSRLESFLTSVGGPLSKALDSRSFTSALFESDTDVQELVTKWHKDNPSATSSALKSTAGDTSSGNKDMNNLLRSAAK